MASAVHKKQSESKYVTCFADSSSKTDITFRDVLLSRPTDHYLVGIDNFSMTNTTLSMIEPQTGNYYYLIRLLKNPRDCFDRNALNPADFNEDFFENQFNTFPLGNGIGPNAQHHVLDFGFDLGIRSTEVILSMQQLMHQLGQLAADCNKYMNLGHCSFAPKAGQNSPSEFGYVPEANDTTEHLKFEMASDGRISIVGTRAFWGCFSIEVPSVRNQFGFFGPMTAAERGVTMAHTHLRRVLSVNPVTGGRFYTKYIMNRFPKDIPKTRNAGETAAQFQARVLAVRAFNDKCVGGNNVYSLVTSTVLGTGTAADFNRHDGPTAKQTVAIRLGGRVFSSLERRVAIEIGCSLPVKNSPMIDHEKETPDFVLGRWIWRTDPRIESNDRGGSRRYQTAMPACTEYQGAQDRITYHELRAQAKIQTLRLKLFARLRTFNELTEKWGMRVIELPTNPSDWWHARLHFMSRD